MLHTEKFCSYGSVFLSHIFYVLSLTFSFDVFPAYFAGVTSVGHSIPKGTFMAGADFVSHMHLLLTNKKKC